MQNHKRHMNQKYVHKKMEQTILRKVSIHKKCNYILHKSKHITSSVLNLFQRPGKCVFLLVI